MAWTEGEQKRRPKGDINEELASLEGFIDEDKAKVLLYRFLKANPTYFCNLAMGVELFPFQHIILNGVMNSDYSMLVCGRGVGKCLQDNALVYTNSGLKMAKDVEVGDRLQSLDNYNTVLAKIINPEDVTYKVTTQKGYSCEGLDYHKVLILNKNLDFEWKFAKDLNMGEYLVMRKNIKFPKERNIFEGFQNIQYDGNSEKKINVYGASSSDWYYLFGLYLGSGYVRNGRLDIVSKDRGTKEFLEEFFNQIGLDGVKYRDADLCILPIELERVFTHVGFTRETPHNQIIPFNLLNNSEENICQLLSGLFDADGYSTITAGKCGAINRITAGYASLSCSMIEQVRALLLQIGIISITEIPSKAVKKTFSEGAACNCNNGYQCKVTGYDNLKKFKEKINFRLICKKEKLDLLEKYPELSKYKLELLPKHFSEYLKNKYYKKPFGKYRFTGNRNISKWELNQIIENKNIDEYDCEKLKKLLDNDLFFEKIKLIEESRCVTVDLQIEDEECYVSDGIISHNSYIAGIAAANIGIFNQGYKIGIISASFRSARSVLKKIEDISVKPDAQMFNNCINGLKKGNDCWTMNIGSSELLALPLGTGEKLRGFRFNVLIIDEFLLFNEKIFNEIIVPFLVVPPEGQIKDRRKVNEIENKLIAQGKLAEEDRMKFENNKLIVLSSASYKFEYLYKLYEQWFNSILNKSLADDKTKFIAQLSYEVAPPEMHDRTLVEEAKSTMSSSAFMREFGAQFSDDSSGFFRIVKMEACTYKQGERPCIEVIGEKGSEYIMSFDPSWAENEASDEFAIHIFKLQENGNAVLVHSYAMPGTSLKDHIHYVGYLLLNFNIVFVIGDYNGALQFISAANESTDWRKNNLHLEIIDAPLNDNEKYDEDVFALKQQYNKSNNKICYLRTPSSSWIREANESLQNSFDKKTIWFAAKAINLQGNQTYDEQLELCGNVDDLNFQINAKGEEDSVGEDRKVDFIEKQGDLIDLTKTECALIQVTSTSQGSQHFDLPPELKRQKGPNRPRKDSYSALVLGNYGIKLYLDLISKEISNTGFIPEIA
jgi:intein/homing endonuclease